MFSLNLLYTSSVINALEDEGNRAAIALFIDELWSTKVCPSVNTTNF